MKRCKVVLLALTASGCLSPTNAGAERPPIDLRAADRIAPDTCGAHWVAGVRGRVRDPSGAPQRGGFVQMCIRLDTGARVCQSPSEVSADGWYAVVVPEETRCVEQVTLRASAGVEVPSSISFCRVAMEPLYGVLDVWEDMVLHPLQTPAAHPPAGGTVRFANGLEMDAAPDSFEFPTTYERLAAGPIDLADAPCFTSATDGLLGLWAFGPESASASGVTSRPVTPVPMPTRIR